MSATRADADDVYSAPDALYTVTLGLNLSYLRVIPRGRYADRSVTNLATEGGRDPVTAIAQLFPT